MRYLTLNLLRHTLKIYSILYWQAARKEGQAPSPTDADAAAAHGADVRPPLSNTVHKLKPRKRDDDDDC